MPILKKETYLLPDVVDVTYSTGRRNLLWLVAIIAEVLPDSAQQMTSIVDLCW